MNRHQGTADVRFEVCQPYVGDAFFITVFPVTSALNARLTTLAAPARSCRKPDVSASILPGCILPSSSTLDPANLLSSLDTGGGIGRRDEWKTFPGLLDDDDDDGVPVETSLTLHDS